MQEMLILDHLGQGWKESISEESMNLKLIQIHVQANMKLTLNSPSQQVQLLKLCSHQPTGNKRNTVQSLGSMMPLLAVSVARLSHSRSVKKPKRTMIQISAQVTTRPMQHWTESLTKLPLWLSEKTHTKDSRSRTPPQNSANTSRICSRSARVWIELDLVKSTNSNLIPTHLQVLTKSTRPLWWPRLEHQQLRSRRKLATITSK